MPKREAVVGSDAGWAPTAVRSARADGTRRRTHAEASSALTLADPVGTVPSSALRRGDEVSPRRAKALLAAADVVAIVVGFFAAFAAQHIAKPVVDERAADQLLLTLLSLPIWAVALIAANLYRSRANERSSDEFRNILTAAGISGLGMTALAFLLKMTELSRFWVVAVLLFVIVSLTIERRLAHAVFVHLRRCGRLSRRVVIVGTDANSIGLVHAMERDPSLGYRPVGFVGPDDLGVRSGVSVLGRIDELPQVLHRVDANGVIISLRSIDPSIVNGLVRQLTDTGVHVTLASSLRDIDARRLRIQSLDGSTLFYVEPTIRSGWRRLSKRTFDIAVAGFGLLIAAPVLAVAAIAIKLESRGPIVFVQERVGIGGRPFSIYKLRTMAVDAEQRRDALRQQNESDGPLFKIRRDPRITRVGKVLRKFSIDEIPQFWNVLRGDMSVVGPRPALPSEAEHWPPELHQRLRVPPGITGLWQVSGRCEMSFEEYKRLDLYYVDNWTLRHDLKIVARTFRVVARGTGAS